MMTSLQGSARATLPAAPSLNVLGSYFPTWMVCFFGALALMLVVRQIFAASGVSKDLPAPVVVHVALLVAFTLGAWLLWVD